MSRQKGLTLIEVLAVVVILSVLTVIAVLTYQTIVGKAQVEVCAVNRSELEKFYENYLVLEQLDHTDALFTNYVFQQYTVELCPINGVIFYVDGEVICSIHSNGKIEPDEEEEDSGVPYL